MYTARWWMKNRRMNKKYGERIRPAKMVWKSKRFLVMESFRLVMVK